MLLVIDVGNTNTVLGVFDGDKLVQDWRIRTEEDGTVDEYGIMITNLYFSSKIAVKDIKAIVVSCVVPPLLTTIEELCRKYYNIKPLIVGPGIKTGMPIYYDNPKEVGADRIVNAVAAYEKYKQSLIIVDFGTATTFDYVSQKGEYQGGVIAPGITISSEALFKRASKLPHVEFIKPKSVVGKDTVSSMQAGIVFGYASLVDGIVERIIKEVKSTPKVIATGGLAFLIASVSETITEVDDYLALKGLRILYERNR
ncbi:MAG: type III pantothenate kinase [Thermodesulfobacteriota bacterium]|nr:type III pantothenate kinase [Thermodesulfobacteriota bacterium]